MKFNDVITHIEEGWKWAADKNCLTGLYLFLFCVLLSISGDKMLYKISPVKAAKPELAPTALIRPLANLVLSVWIFSYVIQTIISTFGWISVCKYFLTYAVAITLFCMWSLGYAYRGPSMGITINVREPKTSFGKSFFVIFSPF